MKYLPHFCGKYNVFLPQARLVFFFEKEGKERKGEQLNGHKPSKNKVRYKR